MQIEMGAGTGGAPVTVDLEELLATRLLVQGNSGSGKSHLLRRLLEGSAGHVQQIVIDPEGDFVSLGDAFGHLAIDASRYSHAEIGRMAERVRETRASVVLSLEGLDIDAQMKCAATFLSALFDAPRDHWYPALVVVDEAQLFAPAAAGEVSDDARRLSLAAMTNLMCRGRKRGLAGVIATQRLAKLAKNVAAEASNFLMGRTFLDIDMARAADLLGMERRQAEAIRDLERGQFLALGPALSRRPIEIRIGAVTTSSRSGSPKLVPLPSTDLGAHQAVLGAAAEGPVVRPPRPAPPPPEPAESVMRRLAPIDAPTPLPDYQLKDGEGDEIVARALADLVADAGSTGRSSAVLFQDFLTRCRMRGLQAPLDLPAFRRRLAMARAGVDEDGFEEALSLGIAIPEDMLAPFLLIARAARDAAPCPSDQALAEVYGTSSLGRARRMVQHLEETGLVAARTDLSGKRSVSVPRLGWTTAPADPDPSAPSRLARPARRRVGS